VEIRNGTCLYIYTWNRKTFFFVKMNIQLPPTLQAAIQNEILKKTTYPRKDSIYTKKDREILGKFKDDYMKKVTRDEKETYFKTFILVDIFNYWYSIGKVGVDILDEELSLLIKVSFSSLKSQFVYPYRYRNSPDGYLITGDANTLLRSHYPKGRFLKWISFGDN
jgi:hypothetical protein